MKAKTYLGRAYRLDLKIGMKLEELERLRSLACSMTSRMKEDKIKNYSQVNVMEEAIVKIVATEKTISNTVDKLIGIKKELSEMLELMENEDERILLELRYLCYKPWEEIAFKMNICCSYVYKLHRKALENFETVMLMQGGFMDD